jgi:hypothetical protein
MASFASSFRRTGFPTPGKTGEQGPALIAVEPEALKGEVHDFDLSFQANKSRTPALGGGAEGLGTRPTS